MPIDETVLTDSVTKMRTVVAAKREDYSDARAVLESLESITMIQDPANPTDPTKKVKPMDPKTHETLSTARRQELYDDGTAKATAYPTPPSP